MMPDNDADLALMAEALKELKRCAEWHDGMAQSAEFKSVLPDPDSMVLADKLTTRARRQHKVWAHLLKAVIESLKDMGRKCS